MLPKERDALRKVYGTKTVEELYILIDGLLNRPGEFRNSDHMRLKNYIIELSVEKLRLNVEPHKQRTAEQRKWIAFVLRYLWSIYADKDYATPSAEVIQIIMDPRNDVFLLEILNSTDSHRLKQVLKQGLSERDQSTQRELTPREKEEIDRIRGIAESTENARRWCQKHAKKLKSMLVAELLPQTSQFRQSKANDAVQDTNTQPADRSYKKRWAYQGILPSLERFADPLTVDAWWIREQARQYVSEYSLKLRILTWVRWIFIEFVVILLACSLILFDYSVNGIGRHLPLRLFVQSAWNFLGIAVFVVGAFLVFWFVYTVSWGGTKLETLQRNEDSSIPA